MLSVRRLEGSLPSGGTWAVELPHDFAGTVCLYSAGYGGAATGEVALAGGADSRRLLLERKLAVAGSRTVTEGWIVGDALIDQAHTVEALRDRLGGDIRVVAWGHSMGGLITAGLAERVPDLIDAALPLCASVAGAIPMLNQGLDAAFALAMLSAPDQAVELVDVTIPDMDRLALGREQIQRARRSPEGVARVALAAALAQIPTWTVDNMFGSVEPGPEPGAGDLTTMLENQAAVLPYVAFSPRRDLERRAGGNFSWNAGIDYSEQLHVSGLKTGVEAAYERAGLELADDLELLANAPRIVAVDEAVAYMERNLTPTGDIGVPILSIATTGDFAPTLSQSAAYADVVADTGRADLLQQAYVHAPGHCGGLTAADIAAGIDAVLARVSSGAPADVAAEAMNARSAAIAEEHGLDLPAPVFADVRPRPHVRPHRRWDRRA